MSELIPVNIVIADRTYRIRTNASDEEIIRKTVSMINEKIIEFKIQFAGKDMQDYIAMVIIWYATQNAGGEGNSMLNKEMAEALTKMELQITETIDKTSLQP
jgi:cell division protein ZapA (FtsZ GTPase activity inhibitor)